MAGISGNQEVEAAFKQSNIDPGNWDYQRNVLGQALAKKELGPSDVLALSQAEVSLKPDGSSMGTRPMLLIILKQGVAMAEEKGVFGKRVETQAVSYRGLAAIPDVKSHDRSYGEIAIQFVRGGSVPLARVGWKWSHGGSNSLAQSTAERDRILDIVQRAMRGDWPGDDAPARADAAGAPPSKRRMVVNWVTAVFRDAGVDPAEADVDKIARSLVYGLVAVRVIPFAEQAVPALARYIRNLPGDELDLLDQLDDIYATGVHLLTVKTVQSNDPSDPTYRRQRITNAATLDELIGGDLGVDRDSYVEGIRRDYGSG